MVSIPEKALSPIVTKEGNVIVESLIHPEKQLSFIVVIFVPVIVLSDVQSLNKNVSNVSTLFK